jgi:glycerol-3-phosphate dehydrogenase
VVGAGVNGAAIAREVALAGRSVLLAERDDVGCGTSAASTRLIHGGLRYLEHGEIGLVRESLAERERLLVHAPHLVEPLELLLPFYRSRGRRSWQIRAGMLLYDLLAFDGSLPGHSILGREALLDRLPALDRDGLTGGAGYFDAQVCYPERLVLELVQDAVAAGATLRTHAPVRRILVEDGCVRGVEMLCDGRRIAVSADTVVNAAGPWVDAVLAGLEPGRLVGGTRGAHLIAAPFPGAPATAVYAEARSDGRPFFVIPWNGLYLIGTTDERYAGDPADARATAAECRYLATETEALFAMSTPLAPFVQYTQAGVRALPHTETGATGAITRRHIVHAHSTARGLYSIVGGKLTTHRALAVDVARRLRRRLRLPSGSPTRRRALPGALDAADRDALLGELTGRFGAAQAGRLWRIYGGAAAAIAARCAQAELAAMAVAPGARVLVAELLHALEHEFAAGLVDLVARRTMAGLDADCGRATAPGAAQWLVRLGIWDSARAAAEIDAYRLHIRRMPPRFDPEPVGRSAAGLPGS